MLMSAVTQTGDPVTISADPVSLPRPRAAKAVTRRILHQGLQCLIIAVLATASYFIISRFLLQSVKIVGRSMVPTLCDSQHYLLNRWVYSLQKPQRSDIVVLRDPSDNGFSVKRIIAAPGDSICLRSGSVYLNGCKLNEPYLALGTPTFSDSKESDRLIQCGKDQYFVLGDNRPNSIDSRAYGPVPRGNILGQLIH
jgi:signal peptidase I